MNTAVAYKHQPATYEDLLALPEHEVGELLNGDLYSQPRPAPRHGIAAGALQTDLTAPFGFGRGGPGGWWIVPEPEIHLQGDVMVPDLAGWRRERLPVIPEEPRFELAPDWVCEILSPSTARKDRVVKMPLYAKYGVAHVWLVDPQAHTLEAFELRQGEWVLIAVLSEQDMVRVRPFDAIEFALADLWA